MANSCIPVQAAAEKLLGYTVAVTSNTHNFPKKYQHTLVAHVIQTAQGILDNIIDANTCGRNNADLRIQYIRIALSCCYKAKSSIRIIYEQIHPGCSIPYWNGMVDDVERQLRAWALSTEKENR